MTISETLLIQMYSMMDSGKLPEVAPSEPEKTGGKSSFQDLMDQTRKDVSGSRKPEDANQDKTQTKDTEQTEQAPDGEDAEQPQLENTNYCAAYLFRPEILPISEESAPVAAAPTELLVQTNPMTQGVQPTLTAETVLPTQTQPQQTAPLEEAANFQSQVQTLTQTGAAPQMVETVSQTPVHMEHTQAPQAETAFTQENPQDSETELTAQITDLSQPLFRDVETAPVKVGETYELDTTSPEMDADLAKTIRDAAMEGVQKLEIQLNPQNLGKIVVELTQHSDGTLQVVLQTANTKSSGLLIQHLDSLNAALQNLGQTQVHVEVQRNQDSANAQQQPFQQADPDGHGQNQRQQQSHKQSQSDSDDFLQQLRLGLFSMEENQ